MGQRERTFVRLPGMTTFSNSDRCLRCVQKANMMAFQFSIALATKAKSTRFHGRALVSRKNLSKTESRRPTAERWRCNLPEHLRTIANSIGTLDEPQARYMRLIHLADGIPAMSDNELHPSTRVPGCTSISHVEVVMSDDRTVKMRGFSDSMVARGLMAFVILGLDGCTADEVAAVMPLELLEASGLRGSVGPSRMMGLTSILSYVQNKVAMLRSGEKRDHAEKSEKHPMDGRWSGRQGNDVAVLLSGGVDSSVALRQIQESGSRPHAFYLKIWLEDELAHLGSCPWEEDMEYAAAVCQQANVKLTDVPFQKAYWDEVVSYTVSEARRGRTPNPDVMCNSRIKFGAFFNRIGRYYDRVATGHYARQTVNAETGLAELRLSTDMRKDQTYFLAHLRQEQIAATTFPLGNISKNEVRELAKAYDLPNKTRKDSQGICFLGKLKFDDFLGHHLGRKIGSLVEFETGRELGQHKGFWFFTIGQRRGVGLSGGPWYVVCKDVERNVVYVSKEYHSEKQQRTWFEFETPLWIAGEWPNALGFNGAQAALRVKTRHGPKFHNAVVTRTWAEGGEVELADGDRGLAPGQFSAFYDDEDRCLGSAVIANDVSLADAPTDIIRRRTSAGKLQGHI